MEDKIKRYPSLRAFNKKEASLFIGREQEKKLLFNKIVAEKITLLFARSGIGKSSLINAGLLPLLEERGFLPLDIRLSASESAEETPLLIFKKRLDHYLDNEKYNTLLNDIRETDPAIQPGLWEYFNCCNFPLASTPVLVFDQFEQFFSFDVRHQDEFILQLRNILADHTPGECLDWLHNINDSAMYNKYKALSAQPAVRVLFAIRSDKIYEMNRLSRILPDILRNRFELAPLGEEEAKKAICLPAAVNNTSLYQSLPYTYNPDLISKIITSLKGRNGIIETTQLQIICSEIENQVILNAGGTADKPVGYEVTAEDLKKIGGIENIISHFYQNQIRKTGDTKNQELARILIEDNLYDKDAKNRKLAFEEAVINILDAGKKSLSINEISTVQFINKLLDLRLIREDYRESKKFYEISHDYLLNAITDSYEEREKKRLEAKNADLERNNRLLQELKVKAENAQAIALQKQAEAEHASSEAIRQQAIAIAAKERADKNYEAANRARKNVVKLKRRNEKLGIAVFLIALAGVIYLVVQISVTKKKKKEIEMLSKRARTGMVSIFSTEAERRYNAGDRQVAYALWDSAANYLENNSDEQIELRNKVSKLHFPLFSGRSVQVSDNLLVIGVKFMNNRRYCLWRSDPVKKEFELLHCLNYVNDADLLPDGRALLTDTGGIVYSLLPQKDAVPKKLFTDTTPITHIEILAPSGIAILRKKRAPYLHIINLKSFYPENELNGWISNNTNTSAASGNRSEDEFIFRSIDTGRILIIKGVDCYLYNRSKSGIPEKIISGRTSDVSPLISNSKIAYNDGVSLKIYDVNNTSEPKETGISLGTRDIPLAFFKNESIILIQHNQINIDSGVLTRTLKLYNLPPPNTEKKDFCRLSEINAVQFSAKMKLIGFTDKKNILILVDAISGKVVYPYTEKQKEPVKEFMFSDQTSQLYVKRTDDSVRIINTSPGNNYSSALNDGSFPEEVFSNQFMLAEERKTGLLLLKYLDDDKNNIQTLQSQLKKYITAEAKSVISK